MGFFSDIFKTGISDLTFQAPNQSYTQRTTDIPSYFTNPAQSLLGGASQLASAPYQAYGGQRQASILSGNSPSLTPYGGQNYTPQGIGQLFYDNAFGRELGRNPADYGALATEAGSADVSRFMNPYISSVWDPVRADMIRTSEQQGLQGDYAATKAGAFGDYRHGIVDSERFRNLNENLGKTQAGIFSQGFNQAGTDKFRALSAQAGFMNQGEQAASTDTQRQLGLGQLLAGEAQKGLDIRYKDFLDQRQDPYDKAKFLSEILKSVSTRLPSSESIQEAGTKTAGNLQATANPLTQGLGLATQLKGAVDLDGILSLLGSFF